MCCLLMFSHCWWIFCLQKLTAHCFLSVAIRCCFMFYLNVVSVFCVLVISMCRSFLLYITFVQDCRLAVRTDLPKSIVLFLHCIHTRLADYLVSRYMFNIRHWIGLSTINDLINATSMLSYVYIQ